MSDVPVVLVTGASGFIATHIIKKLLDAKKYKVRGTVRNLNDQKKIAPLKQLTPDAEDHLQLVQADLLKSDNWQNAVDGCTYVIHTASPFPSVEPANPDDVIKPAVEGTMQILRACKSASTVKRVVLTSSVASVMGNGDSKTAYTEDDWTNPDDPTVITYSRSKTLAEKAAWEFMKDCNSFELAVINPGFVIGPLIHDSECTSAEVAHSVIDYVGVQVAFSVIDVRDVAAAHVAAMTIPDAAGKRHLLVNRTLWIRDIAEILSEEFKPLGYRIPTMGAPYPMVWLMSFVDKGVKLILSSIGMFPQYDNSRMRNVLGIEPINERKSILDMAYSLIERGFVKKTRKYKSPVNQSVPENQAKTVNRAC